MKKKMPWIILLVLVLVLGGAYGLYTQLGDGANPGQLAGTGQPTQSQSGEEGAQAEASQEPEAAPDFTVYDAQGNPVQLSDFLGKPVVLNFWASWCGPCQSEMPDFHEAYQRLGDEVQFLMVNATDGSRETVDTASQFISQQGYTFPVVFDKGLEASMTYGAYALPTTYFIDAQGRAVARASGAISAEILQQGIDMIYPGEGTEA